MEDVIKKLIEHGINPSYHRIRILSYLLEHKKEHPSADMIYRALIKEIPTLSKTTVYNTLNLFVKKGLVIPITIDEQETRFDIDTEPHGHFLCVKCGRIYDVGKCSALFDKNEIEGHKILECRVYLRGICKDCLKH